MTLNYFSGALAAAAMVATPVAASAASVNPASTLSIAPAAVRASSTTAHKSDLAGGAGIIAAIVIAAGIVAIVAIGASNDDTPDSP